MNKYQAFMVNLNKPIIVWCCLSIPPENIRKPKGFLMFSGGADKQHQVVNGLKAPETVYLAGVSKKFMEFLETA